MLSQKLNTRPSPTQNTQKNSRLETAKLAVRIKTTQVEKRGRPRILQGGDVVEEARGVAVVITNSAPASTALRSSPSTIRARKSTPPPTARSLTPNKTRCSAKLNSRSLPPSITYCQSWILNKTRKSSASRNPAKKWRTLELLNRWPRQTFCNKWWVGNKK